LLFLAYQWKIGQCQRFSSNEAFPICQNHQLAASAANFKTDKICPPVGAGEVVSKQLKQQSTSLRETSVLLTSLLLFIHSFKLLFS